MLSVMAVLVEGETIVKEQSVEATTRIGAAIFATAFIAEGYKVKVWDSEANAVVSGHSLLGPSSLSSPPVLPSM